MKIGIVGSRSYTNADRMKLIIQKIVDKFGKENIVIVSGGCPDGADALAKELALGMGVVYQEFPPAHRPHNPYCVLSPEEYNKDYHVSNYFARNGKIAAHSDYVIAFVIKGVRCNGTMDTVTKARRLNKQVVMIEDE